MAGVGLDGALAWWASVDQAPVGELWVPPRVERGTGPDGRPAVAWWPWPAGVDPTADPTAPWRAAWRRQAPDAKLLPAFLRLASLSGETLVEAAVAFCRRYGPLGLLTGRDEPRPDVGLLHPGFWAAPAVLALAPTALPLREPVAEYSALAQRMAALLRVLAACAAPGTAAERARRLSPLHADRAVVASALMALATAGALAWSASAVANVAAALADQPAAAQEVAVLVLAGLLDDARPGLTVQLRPAPWAEDPAAPVPWPTGLTVWPRGAFAALTVQLIAAVAALPRQALCDGCGTVYTPRRRPRAGEAHYCARCGREGGYRAAKRRWWARRQAQQGRQAWQGHG